MKTRYIFAALLLLAVPKLTAAQVKTNVDVIHELIDKSINEMSDGMAVEDVIYYFEYSSLPEYNILGSRALSAVSRKLPLTENESKSTKAIKYNLSKVSVNYNRTFKDGFLGSYKVERVTTLNGNIIISYKEDIAESKDFNFTLSDTLDYDNLKEVESLSLPFARAEIPPEPLLPSLLEPAIAIAAIAVTIVLFFTVRSN